MVQPVSASSCFNRRSLRYVGPVTVRSFDEYDFGSSRQYACSTLAYSFLKYSFFQSCQGRDRPGVPTHPRHALAIAAQHWLDQATVYRSGRRVSSLCIPRLPSPRRR